MEHKKVSKFLEIIGYIFMSLSIIELFFIIALNNTNFDIDGQIPLSEFIFSSNYISLTGSVLWIFLIISMGCYAIVGFAMFKTAKSNKIKDNLLAKLMVVIGMVILLGALVKMDYLVLLGKTDIKTVAYGDISFQSALYDFDITPILPAIFWIYFISATCCFMIAGLIIATLGIKWNLLIEKPEDTK